MSTAGRIKVLVRFVGNPDDQAWLVDQAPDLYDFTFATNEMNPIDLIGDKVILYGALSPEMLAAAPNLRWVQSHATGVEKFLFPEMCSSEVLLTNIKGVLASPIAEHALGMLLYLTRRLGRVHEQTQNRCWKTVPGIEIVGFTALIVGIGHLGREIAKRVRPFGMRILAIDPGLTEAPEEIDELVPAAEILEAVARSQIVFSCCPETSANRGMFNASFFAAMPQAGYFLNLSRGSLVNETDLIDALESGQLAGAGLDVTSVEPYPADGPLWAAPNILISSHSCAYSQKLSMRKLSFFLENLKRYAIGKPLLNLVDKRRGF